MSELRSHREACCTPRRQSRRKESCFRGEQTASVALTSDHTAVDRLANLAHTPSSCAVALRQHPRRMTLTRSRIGTGSLGTIGDTRVERSVGAGGAS